MSFPRYPKYKASGVEWLGKVPEHWEVVQLKQFVEIQNGADHKHVEENDGYPVIGSGGIFAYASSFLYDGESVLLGRKGTIDKPLYVRGRFWTVDTMFWTKIRPEVSGRFAYYAALTIPFDYYTTNTALPSMTKGNLNGHIVARPPLPEQTAIAAFLDRETGKIDALVAEQRRLMELLKEKRQAVISHTVTRGLPPEASAKAGLNPVSSSEASAKEDAPLKDSGIDWLGQVPAHWEVLEVKRVSSFITSGPRGWSERIGEEGSLFIQSGDLNERLQVDFDAAKRVSVEADAEAARTRLLEGDVVVCITGAKTGNVAVASGIPEASYVNQHLCLIRPTEAVLPVFLGVLLKSSIGQTYFELSQYGLKQGLSLENIKEAPVVLPPLAEQTAIVAHLEQELAEFDTLTAEAQRAIDLLQERRTALISAAVTGQIDVRP